MNSIEASMTPDPYEPVGRDDSPRVRQAPADAAAIWVMCRKLAVSGAVETVRAYDDEVRARADLELAEVVSDDAFWLAMVPLMTATAAGAAATSVQRLALTWLAQGAEAEISLPGDDPVVISPRHVRGFVSVPPDEWRRMEELGWVRHGAITPEGRAQLEG
jgi:hypothetical protein